MKTKMIKKKVNIAVFILSTLIFGCNTNRQGKEIQSTKANELTNDELSDGWKLLFDGRTLDGWRGIGKDIVPENQWSVEDGAIRNIGKGNIELLADGQPSNGGDIMTVEQFDNFEFCFEWKILEGGNTGIKYNVSEEMSMMVEPKFSALGFEFQLLDDNAAEYINENSTHLCGSLYDMIPAKHAQVNPVGQYNKGRLIVNGNHVEHWLNSKKVVEFDLGTKKLDSLFKKSKYRDYKGFLSKRKGHIVIQNHNEDVWFRNIKIRKF